MNRYMSCSLDRFSILLISRDEAYNIAAELIAKVLAPIKGTDGVIIGRLNEK